MVRHTHSSQGRSSARFVLVYLVLSIFSALVFSVLYRRAVNKGGKGIIWFILTVVCAALYGTIGYSLVLTSSPTVDSGYYYLGLTTLISNGLAVLVLVFRFFK